uniref:G-protein coupled receptors family 1 profile domain-containing protein n=1 Tax=Knipowitschia caucasica TaxID=637954 RepID=A0AAV2KLS6_KNICA
MELLLNCSDSFNIAGLCSGDVAGKVLVHIWFVVSLLLVPLFLSVLYIGYKRWKKHPRSAVSHADVFFFNIVFVDLINVLATGLFFYVSSVKVLNDIGKGLTCFSNTAELFFHTLTCVERYLAVVHPIVYLRLKKRDGVLIRNISTDSINIAGLCSGEVLVHIWFVVSLLLVPLFLYVLYIGYRRWMKHPRSAVSNADVFIFNIIFVDLLGLLGFGLSLYVLSVKVLNDIGKGLTCFSNTAELFFHTLTCVERYLAVVHPIVYLRLKKRDGVLIRNISTEKEQRKHQTVWQLKPKNIDGQKALVPKSENGHRYKHDGLPVWCGYSSSRPLALADPKPRA